LIRAINYTVEDSFIKAQEYFMNSNLGKSSSISNREVDSPTQGNETSLEFDKNQTYTDIAIDEAKYEKLALQSNWRTGKNGIDGGAQENVIADVSVKLSDILVYTYNQPPEKVFNKELYYETPIQNILKLENWIRSKGWDKEQKVLQDKIDKERQDAIEFEKSHPQNYTEQEKKQMLNYQQDLLPLSNLGNDTNVEAVGLNNSRENLLLYMWGSTGLTLDLNGGNTINGTGFYSSYRHGLWNQRFEFNKNFEIKMDVKSLDVQNGNFNNYTPVQIYTCNSTASQQWYFDGVYLKVLNTNYCLTAALVAGSGAYIYQCNQGLNQRWIAGDNDFTTQRSFKVQATKTNLISLNPTVGHVDTAFFNGTTLVNTFTSWKDRDYESDKSVARYNNMADGDHIQVDKSEDWALSANLPASYKSRSYTISKAISEQYRYNSYYRYPFTLTFQQWWISPNMSDMSPEVNCGKESTRLARSILQSSGLNPNDIPYSKLPTEVYDAI
jgi:hypothetical protein